MIHEANPCNRIIVASPVAECLELCNKQFDKCLFRCPVDPQKVVEQHHQLLQTLLRNKVTVIDVMDHVDIRESVHYGNLIFTRDPILRTQRGIILGRFKEDVRNMELDVVANVLAKVDTPVHAKIEGQMAYVEGGDFIPHGKQCLIAVGNRTNMEGVHEMMVRDLFGTDTVYVVKYPSDGDMRTIHLDCYLGLVGKAHAFVWEQALKRVVVDVYQYSKVKKTYVLKQTNISLRTCLMDLGYDIIPVPTRWQRKYSCNLVDLGKKKVLTQCGFVTRKLEELGYDPIYIRYDEIHKMYGGLRCTTNVLCRNFE